MKFRALSCLVVAFVFACLSGVTAKADTIFTGSQAGLCCFDVSLHQVDSTNMQVTVSLTTGAQYFVATGSGNHPGFAFNLAGDPTVSVTSISGPWTLSDVHLSSIGTNGPSLGTFDYFIDNPGPGGSKHNAGPLVFNIFDTTGITYSDFIANSSGFYFAADIMNSAGQTGMSGINTPGSSTPAVPEPGSITLLGTGALAAAGFVRRKLFNL